MANSTVRTVRGWQALNTKGDPTLGTLVVLEDGSRGVALVPTGTSTGGHEAVELRDGDAAHFAGRGVLGGVAHIEGPLQQAIRGIDAANQRAIDEALLQADGTDNKSRYGANALLAISMAAAKAAAASAKRPLWEHAATMMRGNTSPSLPMPMFSILTGGRHALGAMPVQDFLAIPIRARDYAEAVEIGWTIWTGVRTNLTEDAGVPPVIADTGGFRYSAERPETGLEVLADAVRQAGMVPGSDVVFGTDIAANEMMSGTGYHLHEGVSLSADQLVDEIFRWVDNLHLRSIEDVLHEDDWNAWTAMTTALGSRCQVIGDDLFATNEARLERGILERAANCVLLKPNQCGTLTETLDVYEKAVAADMAAVVSQRSGETEDSMIADLAVGWGIGQAKFGSLNRSERLAKHNRLLQIEAEAELPFYGTPRTMVPTVVEDRSD